MYIQPTEKLSEALAGIPASASGAEHWPAGRVVAASSSPRI